MNSLLSIANLSAPLFLTTLILAQVVYVVLYLRQRRIAPTWYADYAPPAAVILCLRGRDPTLECCLEAIGKLDYPDFEIHTVFDSAEDPALPVVEAFRRRCHRNIKIHFVASPRRTCGMKCAALITAIESLPDHTEVIALVDADSIVAPNWLAQIVEPLQDSQIGAVTGDRWFEPGRDLASAVRAVWNAAAIVQMNLYHIAWGGALAMRRETVEKLKILNIWKQTFCEDTVLADLFASNGLRVVRPREVVVFNRETIAWKNLHFWIARQLLTVRLHNRKWPFVFGHGLLVGLSLFACLALLPINLLIGDFETSLLLALVLLGCELVNFAMVAVISLENTKILHRHRQITGPTSLRRNLGIWLLAIPLTQVMHFLSTLRATTMKYVIWRGIEYRVTPREVELIHYRPFLDRNVAQCDMDSVN